MSALGQKQTSDWRPLMSALPPKADIAGRDLDVRFVPLADIRDSFPGTGGSLKRCATVNMSVSP
jgi:hypothetical protein